jgi:cell fate regulator YaaT (PSP1 superfamily)
MDTAENITNINITRGCCIVNSGEREALKVDQQKCCKLTSYNWLKDFPDNPDANGLRYAEVRFKNDRKDFFSYPVEMILKEGEIVAVEANPGHEIGIVSLTGDVVRLQMRRKKVDPAQQEIKKIYRHARVTDVEKWLEAVKKEPGTLTKSREVIAELGLDMKLNDVEYQGDKTKAIFYYTAADRVDLRQLIRRLADIFKIRVEMRQIGVRQEAAKLGGIGSCGRELCCSSFMSSFKSVSTNAARIQQLSLNPQKLAGQCGKLKCCLNYELDSYVDALKDFPDNRIALKTKKGTARHQKSDVFKGIMWYAYTNDQNSMLAIPVDKVKKIMDMNSRGKIPADLEQFAQKTEQAALPDDTASDDDFVSYI